jgi:regulator of protease activity HflC (stomatin/prohibitin superfamily)
VKDLIFPGDLQQIMNRVLAAERMSQVQLVEARASADVQRLQTQVKAETERAEAEARAAAQRLAADAEAQVQRIKTEADIAALRQREASAEAYKAHPALLRLEELGALRELASTANARIYIDFERPRPRQAPDER